MKAASGFRAFNGLTKGPAEPEAVFEGEPGVFQHATSADESLQMTAFSTQNTSAREQLD